jgi:hypothetical protein
VLVRCTGVANKGMVLTRKGVATPTESYRMQSWYAGRKCLSGVWARWSTTVVSRFSACMTERAIL